MNQHSVLPYATPHLGMGKGDFNAFQNTNLPGRMFYIVFFFFSLLMTTITPSANFIGSNVRCYPI